MSDQEKLEFEYVDLKPMLLIRLSGFCAKYEVYTLKSKAEELVCHGSRFVIIDLNGLRYIDSSGIGALGYIQDKCKNMNGLASIVLSKDNQVSDILRMCKINDFIQIFPTEEQARHEIMMRFGLNLNGGDDHGPMTKSDIEYAAVAIAEANEQSVDKIIKMLESLIDQVQHIDSRINTIDEKLTRFDAAMPSGLK